MFPVQFSVRAVVKPPFAVPAGRARLVMRQRGNLRLLLNANLWEDMAVNVMDGGLGVTFAVHNAAAAPAADGKEGSAEAAGEQPPFPSCNLTACRQAATTDPKLFTDRSPPQGSSNKSKLGDVKQRPGSHRMRRG